VASSRDRRVAVIGEGREAEGVFPLSVLGGLMGGSSRPMTLILELDGQTVAQKTVPYNDGGREGEAAVSTRQADYILSIGFGGGIGGRFTIGRSTIGGTDIIATDWTEFFGGPYDDVTDDVAEHSVVTCSRGLDNKLAAIESGQSSFTLIRRRTSAFYDRTSRRRRSTTGQSRRASSRCGPSGASGRTTAG